MDLNERFREPNTTGLNDRFVQSTFQPLVDNRVAPIEPTVYEGVKSLWNPVGEFVRDNVSERVGKLIQPKTVVRDGNRQATENKTFNSKSAEDLNNKLSDLTASSPEEADGVLYKLKNPSTGEIKYGKAGDSVWDRYKGDMGFQSNWIVEYERPMKDTAYAERLIHGNEEALKQQSLDYGKASSSSLNAGGTEVYMKDPLDKQIVKDSVGAVSKLLEPEQANYASRVWDGLKIRTGFSDIDSKGNVQKTDTMSDILSNVNKARLQGVADTILGARLGTTKIAGGINELVGNKEGLAKDKANALKVSNQMIDKNGMMATIGEIVPELAIPAVLKAPKAIQSLAGRALYGAGTGASLAGGTELLKEKSGIKEGLDTNIKLATGLGAIIGGIVGALTKNPILGKTIGEAFVAGDDKAKEAIMTSYPETRGALEEYMRNQITKPKVESTVTKSDTIEPEVIPYQKKSRVKPTVKKEQISDYIDPQTGKIETESTVSTKKGVEIKSADVLEGKQKIEDLEYESVSPKNKEGKPLQKQTYVPEVNNPMKFKYGYDLDGRVYIADSHLSSPQGDATQMASWKAKETPQIDSAVNEVERRLQFYDTTDALKQRYGQAQASYKETGKLTDKQIEANRLQFEKEQYESIRKDKTLPKEIIAEARKKYNELKNVKIEDYKPTKTQKEAVEEKFISQHKVPTKSKESILEREKELAIQRKIYLDSKSKRTKEGFNPDDIDAFIARQEKLKAEGKPFKEVDISYKKTPEQILEQIATNAKEQTKKASLAKIEIEKKVAETGKKFDIANITDEQRKMFRDEIGTIEDVQNAKTDYYLFSKEKIDADELQWREKRRIEDRLAREKESKFKTIEEAEAYRDSVIKQYNDIGVYVSRDDMKLDKKFKSSGKPEKPEAKAKREAKEIEESTFKHEQVKSALEEYKITKQVPRHQTGEKAGRPILTKEQMKQVDNDVLELREIADQSAPIGLKQDISDLKVEAKEKASYLHTEKNLENLNLEWKVKPKDIRFKDTYQDVANSVGQITAVLLGSKNLANLVRSGGKSGLRDSSGKLLELRNEIGKTMEKNGFKKPVIIKNGKELSWKDLIKPTFMTKNYGQQRKGLLRNLQKDFKFTKEQSEKFLNEYEKAFMQVAPEMKAFEERILASFKGSNGKISFDMPDGFPVRMDIKKNIDGSFSIKGEENKIKFQVDGIDDLHTGILPNIIQSADSYIMRYMNKKGITGKFDAFMTPAGKSDDYVREVYGEAMAELNRHDVIGNILKSLGDTKPSPKIGDLLEEDIKMSAKNAESLEPEEIAGMVTKAGAREIDLSKVTKTETDVLKEFMAKDNVRQQSVSQLPKVLAHESGLRTMSIAKSGDDVFERQFALAHQSSTYNALKGIKPPKGVNRAIWNKTQKEIFEEARARLENNPLLNGVIQGERKFFTESGKLIGDKTKTYNELMKAEIVKGKLEVRRLNREAKQSVKEIAPTYEKLQIKVKSWEAGKKLNNAESIAKEIVENARQPKPERSAFKKNIDKIKAYFKDQVSSSKETKDFQQLFAFRSSKEGNVAEKAEAMKKQLDKMFKGHKSEDLTDSLLKTDYHAIQELKNADEAEIFLKDNDNIYQLAKRYIDQSAKAIGESSQQIGFFRNNAKAIANELDLPEATIPIIDKLISIKAMTPKSWNKIAELRETDDFKQVMEIISENKRRSTELFKNNPNQQVKGFVSEYYPEAKEIVNGKIRYDASTGVERGAIPSTLENKKVGSYQEEFPSGDFANIIEKSEHAEKHGLKITEEGFFRKVTDAELKDKAGRSKSFSDILSKTTQSIGAKEAQHSIAKNIIDEMVKENEMFSQVAKDGYRLITDIETSAMPKVIKDSLAGRYVNEAYDKRLFGREEVRLYSGTNHVGQVADRLLKDTITNFKLNVVLKNPKSHLNAVLVNQLLGAMSGVNPVKLTRYQKQAFDEIKQTDMLKEKIAMLEARGQDTKVLQNELEKSLLYKMEQAGLAINKLEVAGDDATLLGQIISDISGNTKIGNWIGNTGFITQKSWLGNKAFKGFSVIDTTGRYTVAKSAMDNGKTIEEAVAEANGLYSDMGQMAPAFIELMDKYPFIPFMKWASLTMPRLLKLTKNNPVKAFSLGIIVYGFQIDTQLDFSSVNPLEAIINFSDDAVSLDYINASIEDGFGEATYNRAKTFFIPKVYGELKAELLKPEQHDFFLKDWTRGRHQPLTQRITNE